MREVREVNITVMNVLVTPLALFKFLWFFIYSKETCQHRNDNGNHCNLAKKAA